MIERSDFGKGYSYCLGLFLMHAERYLEKNDDHGLWFNGAADHLFEFEAVTPREQNFKDKCLRWRLEKYTNEDKEWALEEALELLKLYDNKNCYQVVKGDYE